MAVDTFFQWEGVDRIIAGSYGSNEGKKKCDMLPCRGIFVRMLDRGDSMLDLFCTSYLFEDSFPSMYLLVICID